MMDKRMEFAKALRAPDPEAVKRITAHFEAQADIFTECQRCHERIHGTLAQVTAHICFGDILCSP